MTDPPYYDAVPYADLSDFFYVLLKRSTGQWFPDLFRSPLTPKTAELIEERSHASLKQRKNKQFYEDGMASAFREMSRTMGKDMLTWIMFAHKSTSAWETIIAGLIKSRLIVTTSWPFHTERPGRLRAQESAALASSVTLVCRKRLQDAGDGLWDDVRQELKPVAKERLDFFWSQGIRGADFFISAIGPALSVFGKYERVTKLSGEEVTVGQFLDEVRGLVTAYALSKIMKTTQTASIDPESRFYVVWKWSYGDTKVPADESFKLAMALGMDTEIMWDRTGVLEKSGENVQAVAVAKRMKVKDLGEPNADGTPASLINVLHRLCVFREKGDNEGMAEFLGRSGQGRNSNLWLVAQAVSEILPDGDKEKQLMQGLLNQRDQLEKAGEQGKLF
jgi:adenine-specific DNA methylase